MKLKRRWASAILAAALAAFLAGAAASAQQLTGPAPESREGKAPAEPRADEVVPARQEPRPSDAPRPSETGSQPRVRFDAEVEDVDAAIDALVADMPLTEKIGQLCQVAAEGAAKTQATWDAIRFGQVGSIINAPDRAYVDEAQRIAREESPHGIPLLIGRDVIHGYRTVFPIPLGQAASWHPELVERAAAVAAGEAASEGINWTFAPMVDVCRDPRWGRIAETLGEDPLLASDLAAAMVRGFQQEDDDGKLHGLVACV
ncbi:MAG TPA: glycoside hydrolase family 3 N-terminal domain-containing protein, partial [Lacipirellula sp.]